MESDSVLQRNVTVVFPDPQRRDYDASTEIVGTFPLIGPPYYSIQREARRIITAPLSLELGFDCETDMVVDTFSSVLFGDQHLCMLVRPKSPRTRDTINDKLHTARGQDDRRILRRELNEKFDALEKDFNKKLHQSNEKGHKENAKLRGEVVQLEGEVEWLRGEVEWLHGEEPEGRLQNRVEELKHSGKECEDECRELRSEVKELHYRQREMEHRTAILMPIWHHIILDAAKQKIAALLSVPNWKTLSSGSRLSLDNLVSHIEHGLNISPQLPLHPLERDTIEYVCANNNPNRVAGNKAAHIAKRSEVREAIFSSFLSNTLRKHLEALYLFLYNKSVFDDEDDSLIHS